MKHAPELADSFTNQMHALHARTTALRRGRVYV